MSVTVNGRNKPAASQDVTPSRRSARPAAERGPVVRRRRSCGAGRCWRWRRWPRCVWARCWRRGRTRRSAPPRRWWRSGPSVQRGEVITREDLVTVRVGVDPALKPIPAAQLDSIVGQRAALDLAAGGLVTAGRRSRRRCCRRRACRWSGWRCRPGCCRGSRCRSGDRVRVVATPGEQGEVTARQAAVDPGHGGGAVPGRRQRPDGGVGAGAVRSGGGAGGPVGDRQGRVGAGLAGAVRRWR